jgi:AcrR family transcriptional regulator
VSATKPRRLTRVESQQRTRALIVDAATRLFLRDGFRVTSLERIAEEAGFTRGAAYSNFDGKTAMGIAVIDKLYAREEQRLTESLQGVPDGDRDALFETLSAWADSTIGDPDWTRLEIEIAGFSAHEDVHRAATAARYAQLRDHCRELIVEHLDVDSALDPGMLATAIVGLALGVGAQRAADPSIPGSTWSEALRALVGERSRSAAARP